MPAHGHDTQSRAGDRLSFSLRQAHGGSSDLRFARLHVHGLFWFGLFLPVNVVFQGLCFEFGSFQFELDSALYWIAFFKTAYFLMFIGGVVVLQRLWQALAERPERRWGGIYRGVGLVSVAALLIMHGEAAYHLGRPEREIHRQMRALNKLLGSVPQGEAWVEPIQLRHREWVYAVRLAHEPADPAEFSRQLQSTLKPAICSDAWTQRLFEFGVRIHVVYRDSMGGVVADEAFVAADCAGRG